MFNLLNNIDRSDKFMGRVINGLLQNIIHLKAWEDPDRTDDIITCPDTVQSTVLFIGEDKIKYIDKYIYQYILKDLDLERDWEFIKFLFIPSTMEFKNLLSELRETNSDFAEKLFNDSEFNNEFVKRTGDTMKVMSIYAPNKFIITDTENRRYLVTHGYLPADTESTVAVDNSADTVVTETNVVENDSTADDAATVEANVDGSLDTDVVNTDDTVVVDGTEEGTVSVDNSADTVVTKTDDTVDVEADANDVETAEVEGSDAVNDTNIDTVVKTVSKIINNDIDEFANHAVYNEGGVAIYYIDDITLINTDKNASISINNVNAVEALTNLFETIKVPGTATKMRTNGRTVLFNNGTNGKADMDVNDTRILVSIEKNVSKSDSKIFETALSKNIKKSKK